MAQILKLEKLEKAIEEMNIENATPEGYRQVENEIARLENQNLHLRHDQIKKPLSWPKMIVVYPTMELVA